MNANNNCSFVGRIPSTDKIKYDFHEPKKDGGTPWMSGSVSVRRTRKANKDDKYAPDDLIAFKVWGKSAEYMRDYVKRGDYVSISGELQQEDDWEDQDGNKHYGRWFINVDAVSGLGSRSNSAQSDEDDEDESAAVEDVTPKKAAGGHKNPFANKMFAKKSA